MATTTQVRELFKLLTGWQRTSGLNREPLPEPAEVITVFAPFAGEGAIGELNDIPDVDTTGKSVGDVLKWNGTNWVADTDATGEAGTVALDDLTDVVLTAAATGQILEKSATNWVNVTPKKRVVASFLMTGTDGGNLTLGNVSKDAAVGTITGVRGGEGKYTITLPAANSMAGFAVAKLIPKMTIVSEGNAVGDFKIPTITSMALSTNDLVVVMEVYYHAMLNSGDIVAGETLHVDIELIP